MRTFPWSVTLNSNASSLVDALRPEIGPRQGHEPLLEHQADVIDERRLRACGQSVCLGLDIRLAEPLVDGLADPGRIDEERALVALEGGLDPHDLERPVDAMEAVDEDDLALLVHHDEDGVVLDLREVEAGVVPLVLDRLLELARRTVADVPEDLARAFEELGLELLAEDALRKARALGLDALLVEVRVRA